MINVKTTNMENLQMKTFIYTTLYLLLFILTGILFLFGIDMDTARRDYEKALSNGDYEKPIVGCIFDTVCNKYTERLYNK